jgi:1-acyl-sn-glycerol-3-phosphate acyltransferase
VGERLDVAWRVAATAFCFLVFGLAGLGLALFGLPLLHLVPAGARRTRAARERLGGFFRFFIELMRVVGVLSYELHGVERLARPRLLILANHPTLVDVIFIISLVPQSGCLVKSSLARNPFTRAAVGAAGYITNDAGVALVEDCRASLERGESLLIFPEGTRTPIGGAVEFRRGAANVAIRCRQPVTPVSIRCQPRGLARSQRWYQVPPRRMHFTICVHDELQVDSFLEAAPAEPLAVRRLNAHLMTFFEQESRRAAT